MADREYRDVPRRWPPIRQTGNCSKRFQSLVLLACGISIAAVASAAPVRWERAVGGNGHLYQVVLVGSPSRGPITWDDARKAAKALGPGWDLATITTAQENEFVKGLFETDPKFFNEVPEFAPRVRSGPWIGAYNVVDRNTFQWVTGEPVSFTDWGPFFYSGRRVSYGDFSYPWADGSGIYWYTSRYGFDFYSPIAYIAESSGPPEVGQLALRQATVAGCKSVTGTVTIPQPAPAAGVVVHLGVTLASASTPATVTIPAGATSSTFTLRTTPVKERETGTVRATLAGTTLSQPLTVRPIGLLSVAPSSLRVVGGHKITGKAALECRAAPAPIMVDLGSDDPALASPVASSIVVPQGMQSETFELMTYPVLQMSSVSITATANAITKSKRLTLNPAASVSPTRLDFGFVRMSPSPRRSVTLSNKGTTSFSITDIGLKGRDLQYFMQAHNCPVRLAPGASCTIVVWMWFSKRGPMSADLSIATTATSSPLRVGVSATSTGINP